MRPDRDSDMVLGLRRLIQWCVCAGLALPAFAADPAQSAIQRGLLERQQQADDLVLRNRQAQERMSIPRGDLPQMQELERRHHAERLRLESLNSRQRSQMDAQQAAGAAPGNSAATDLPRLARERELELLQMRIGAGSTGDTGRR